MSLTQFKADMAALIERSSISAFEQKWDQSNRAVIDWLGNRLGDLNFHISIQAVPDSRNKFNLLAKIGSGDGGLLLSGHSDTVPFDEGRWQQDPFRLKEQEDRLYGLGTCDMKGFFAFVLQALNDVPLQQLQKPLYILATADEETSMAGARFFAEQQLIQPDMAVIGEPTELKPIVRHKGHMAVSLDIQGQSGHSSDPAKGVNAIEIMHQAIGELIKLRDNLRQHQDPAFSVPEATLNLGHIHGGDAENRICGHCKLNFDIRAVPGLSDNAILAELDAALAPLNESYPTRISQALMYPSVPSFACKNEHRIIDLAEQLTGFSAQSANYCTEAPFLNQLNCDTLVMGPGSITQAHQPNEFVALDYLPKTTRVLQQFIRQVCF